MDKLSGRVGALTAEQRALLEARAQKKGLTLGRSAPAGGGPGARESGPEKLGAPSLREQSSRNRDIEFSLYFFSDDGASTELDKYGLLLESARFADAYGFSAIWTPERHFQKFGGLYPNPSVLSAALAVVTTRIQIRAGSVALPLHHPARVAEEWSVVDNLSKGRVGVSFASGWHPNDFIFAPSAYENRKDIMFDYIRKIQRLWAGEEVLFEGPNETSLHLRIFPKPVQPRLPVWITTAGNPATWAKAGEIGANVLCAFVGYSFDDLEERIHLYRQERVKNGHDPRTGHVTAMVHAYIGEDDSIVRAMVREPMCNYLRSYFRQFEGVVQGGEAITEADRSAIVSRAFESYYDAGLLIGPMDKCEALTGRLADAGVDELACLVDFGLEFDTVLEGLGRLRTLKQKCDSEQRERVIAAPATHPE
jgi:natural product biosynthesis luciferase-like monooxygenase protein